MVTRRPARRPRRPHDPYRMQRIVAFVVVGAIVLSMVASLILVVV